MYHARTTALRPRHLDLLDDVEHRRRERYVNHDDRDRFTAAAVLLRIVVGLRLGVAPSDVEIDRTCTRCRKPHGPPRLRSGTLEVSVTHSGELVAIAISSSGPVGVDVELARPIDLHLHIAEVCSPEERSVVTDLASFYVCWTRKESVLKAAGVGLRVPMSSLRVTPAAEPPRLLRFEDGPPIPARMIDTSPAAGYVGAVCVLSPAPVEFRVLDQAVNSFP